MGRKRTPPPSQREHQKRAPRKQRPKTAVSKRKLAGETPDGGPPKYDPVAVGRIAKRVNILAIELLNAQFERNDGGPLPENDISEAVPEIGMFAEWAVSDDETALGCAVNFSAAFDDEDAPYSVFVRLRVVYLLDEGEPLQFADIEQFVHWNAVFNAWPYWREILSSIISRAQLPRFIVPVVGVPRAS